MTDHWVAVAARRAGLAGAEGLRLDPTLPAAQAWREAAGALGLTEADLTPAIARHFRLATADLDGVTESALKLVPEPVVRKYAVLPLRQTDCDLVVATSDPSDLGSEQALGFASGRTPILEVAPPTPLEAAIERCYPEDRPAVQMLSRLEPREREDLKLDDHFASEVAAARGGESAAVVRLTNLILRRAVAAGASRMELEPVEGGGRIVLLVDGMERHFMQMPAGALARVIARLNAVARLGLTAPARRQAGSTRMQVGGRTYDVAITIVPVDRGRHRAVVKFAQAGRTAPLDELGLPDAVLATLRAMLGRRHGLIVVAGPPASGKTTLLYAMALELARERSVATLEEAIERTLDGVPQHRPELLLGVNTVQALEGALASGASAIFVDAPLDLPLVERLHRATSAGRLIVLAAEAGDVVAGLRQITEAGLPGERLAAVLVGVTGQLLMRRLCDDCAAAATPLTDAESDLAALLGVRPARRAVGCARCVDTGYDGLVPAADAAPAGPAVARALQHGESDEVVRALVQDGFRGAAAAAADRVAEGASTLEELQRAFGPVRLEPPPTRLLLADDDAETVLLARTVLEQSGFEVAVATDGIAALESIAAEPFALVILDLNMPRMDGREVLQRLKGRIATSGLPVVVLTGSSSADDEVMVMEEGAEDYIRKPIDPPRFLARVRAALRRTGATS